MNLKFLGAARTVTGSRTLCHHGSSRVLVDCGMFQGPKRLRLQNWAPLPEADALDAVILTHAHIDHSGLIPRLVNEGFQGPIYCSEGTLDLCRILLLDSAKLQEEDAGFANKTGYSHHKPALPLYTSEDVHRALKQFRAVKREAWVHLSRDLSFRLSRSGHITGSSFVELMGSDGNGGKTVLFSGDVGTERSPIMRPPVTGLETDTLILESTYGDRVQIRGQVEEDFAWVVRRVVERGGVLLIPAFSVGRTQEVLFLLNHLKRDGRIPDVPVYVDSPMANKATEVFLRHPEDYLPVLHGDALKAPVSFESFKSVVDWQDSKRLTQQAGPMVVLSAAGMLTGGRIMHHLKQRLSDERNLILFVGYQAEETKGRLLQQGIKSLRIHHQEIPVRAEIITLEGLSAHADQNELVAWVKSLRHLPRRVFINHGDNGAPEILAERLRSELGLADIHVPAPGEEFELW